MRHMGDLFLALSAALLLLGCESNTATTPTTGSKVSDAREKVMVAAEATTDAAKEKRDEFIREMSKRLDELNVKYEELKRRAAAADGQGKKDLQRKLEEANVRRDAAAKKIGELQEAGADRWEKIKDGVGSALDHLKKIFE